MIYVAEAPLTETELSYIADKTPLTILATIPIVVPIGGVHAVMFNPGWTKDDAQFRELFMPGEISGTYGEFEIWKAISLDRMRFFWSKPGEFPFADSDFVVQLNIHSQLPWHVAKKSQATAVKCRSLLERELIDFAPYIPARKVVVSYEEEEGMLRQSGYQGKIECLNLGYPQKKGRTGNSAELAKVYGESVIVYDKENDYLFRSVFNGQTVFCSDARSKQIVNSYGIAAYSTPQVFDAATKVTLLGTNSAALSEIRPDTRVEFVRVDKRLVSAARGIYSI